MSIPAPQITKAVLALRSYLNGTLKNKQSPKLIDDGEYYEICINLSKIIPPKSSCSASLKHSIYNRPELSICLLTTDPVSDIEKSLEENPIPCVNKVIGAKELATSFKPFEHRRVLRKQYDLFIAQDSIIPQLPQLLGVKFYQSGKSPIKAHGKTAEQFLGNVRKAVNSAHYHIPTGTSFIVRVGHSSQNDKEIAENIISAIPQIVTQLPKKWGSISSINLKTSTSAALPIYAALPVAKAAAETAAENKLNTQSTAATPEAVQTKEVEVKEVKKAKTSSKSSSNDLVQLEKPKVEEKPKVVQQKIVTNASEKKTKRLRK